MTLPELRYFTTIGSFVLVVKKPVTVGALALPDLMDAEPATLGRIAQSLRDAGADVAVDTDVRTGDRVLRIKTLEGTMTATPGEDVILRGVHGEFYPCKTSVFLETYDLAPDWYVLGGQA